MTNVRYRVGIRGQEVCLNLYGDGTVLITTGGSATSEGCCAAIQDAIEKAAEKLKPTLETLKAGKKEGEKVTYKELVGMGGACTVGALQFTGVCTHLGANEGWFGGPRAGYCIFGAACSEVEVG